MNVPFLLHAHLNHISNQWMVPELYRLEAPSPIILEPFEPSILRLLKLLCCRLFRPDPVYRSKQRIGMGRYGKVYECRLASGQQIALKLFDMPRTIHDDCVLFDVFTEITCLEALGGQRNAMTLFDFGVSDEV